VSQVEAADRMQIPFQRLNAIVKGRRAVSADTALLLEALTGWDAQIWLTLQSKWDLWHAIKARGRGRRSAGCARPRSRRCGSRCTDQPVAHDRNADVFTAHSRPVRV
jgi:addiction module HigA family antidote